MGTGVTRWDPFAELAEASERFNRVFNRPVKGVFDRRLLEDDALVTPEWAPACDIHETDGEYLIKADLPDVKKDDVKVSVQDGILAIQGERLSEKEEKGKKVHRVERSFGRFLRTFALPTHVDSGEVNAQFKDGVLTVHLPKTASATPKAIDVKVA